MAMVATVLVFKRRLGAAATGMEFNESESWERIAKREIEARAEDKHKAVDRFAEKELERVGEQIETESKMAKRYQTTLAELEETKTELADRSNQLKEMSANLANEMSRAKAAQASLLEEKQEHRRDVNSWRHAAKDVLLKVKTRLQHTSKESSRETVAQGTKSTSLLDAGEHAQTPEQFTSLTVSLLDAAEYARQLAKAKEKEVRDKKARQSYLRSNGGPDMMHDDAFEHQLESYVPGESPLPGVDTNTGHWSKPVKNPPLAARFPDIPAFQ